MKRILASVGIGNASVDTVLPSSTVTPGESVDADGEFARSRVRRYRLFRRCGDVPKVVRKPRISRRQRFRRPRRGHESRRRHATCRVCTTRRR
nr:sporulation protein [Halogranum rubrum]